MKTHIIFLVMLLAVSSSIDGQSYFFKSIPLFDGNDTGWTLVPLDDGYLIGAGSISYAENQAFTRIVKTDLEGNLVWKRDYENFPYQFGLGKIESIGDTLFAVSGEFYAQTYKHRYRMFIDENGDSTAIFIDEVNAAGGNVVVRDKRIAYYSWQQADGESAQPYLMITDTEGNVLLDTVYTDKVDWLQSSGFIDVCPDGSYILSMKEEIGYGNYFMRVDPNGNELSFREGYKERKGDTPFVGCLDNGDYVSIITDIDSFISGLYLPYGELIERRSADEELIWQHFIKHPRGFGQTDVWGMTIAKNGDIIVVGTHKTGQDTIIPGIDRYGAWILRMSSETGEVLWERSYHYLDGYDGTIFTVEEDKEGNIVCAGDILDTIPDSDNVSLNIWLIKLDSNGCLTPDCTDSLYLITSVEETDITTTQTNLFSVQPNPATDLVWMNITQRLTGDPWRFQVHTITGKFMHEEAISKGEQTIPIYLTEYSPGMYVVSLLHRNRVVDARRVVVE